MGRETDDDQNLRHPCPCHPGRGDRHHGPVALRELHETLAQRHHHRRICRRLLALVLPAAGHADGDRLCDLVRHGDRADQRSRLDLVSPDAGYPRADRLGTDHRGCAGGEPVLKDGGALRG